MIRLSSAFLLMTFSATAFSQQVMPPQSKSEMAKFLSTDNLIFVTDGKDFGSFDISDSYLTGSGEKMQVTAVVIWDYKQPNEKFKALRFRAINFYQGFTVDLYIDYDELGDLQKFWPIFDQESENFKPSKGYWRRVEFKSRGGVGFCLDAYDNKRDLNISIFDRSVYLLTKDRDRIKNMISDAKSWLDDYGKS